MTRQSSDLLAAFQEDHAALGKGFHELSVSLRGGDVAGARRLADVLDEAADAHIAFEVADFYPRLDDLIGEDERRRLIAQSEAMVEHIAGCGALFESIGRIPKVEQDALYRRLLEWRRRSPTWRGYAAEGAPLRRPRSG